MSIVDASAVQCWRELVAIELRIMARSWNRPNIDNASNAVRLEQADEPRQRTRGVPDREDEEWCHSKRPGPALGAPVPA